MTKILTAHQPAYLPWLGLFHKINVADIFVFLDNVKYSKSDKFINRNFIKKNSKQAHRLTVPLATKGSDSVNILDLKIDNTKNWQQNHFSTIQNFYSKSRFGKNLFSHFKPFYSIQYESLANLCFDMLMEIIKILKINTKIVRASDLDLKFSKNEYLVELCRKFECNAYVFGKQGANYVDPALWKNNNIKYYIQEYNHPSYTQLFGDFIPYLSIIDLLFNEGPEKGRELLLNENIKKMIS